MRKRPGRGGPLGEHAVFVQLGAGVPATAPTAAPAGYDQEWATVLVVPSNHSFTRRTLATSLDLISYRRTGLVNHGRGLKHYEQF